MTIRLSIDRFEGDKKQIAVLLAEDGTAINFPKALLPKGARAGDPRRSRSSATVGPPAQEAQVRPRRAPTRGRPGAG